MKKTLWAIVLYASWLNAQVSSSPVSSPITVDSSKLPALVEVGPHHRVWQTLTVDDHGRTNASSYTELATGLNYLSPATGQWEESRAEFRITENGYAAATNGQHKVMLAANINSAGSVDLLTPDGKRFLSNPMGLSFFDTATGTNTLLAEVKDCVGQFIPPNVILYDDAFTDIKGAIRYVYTKAGFEQDVLIYDSSGLGSPADYGLNPETTLLEMYSEFHEAPTPEKITQVAPDLLSDETLNFGAMMIGSGKAFGVDAPEPQIPVAKAWQSISGRTFLIESVRYPAAKPLLDSLKASASNENSAKVAGKIVADRKRLIAMDEMRPRTRTKELASITPRETGPNKGFVLDYLTLNTGQTNYTFKGDSTYFITGSVALTGLTEFESGAVIKFDTSSTPCLWVLGSVNCQATPYRPIILTAKDDDAVGEAISGSTGSPTAGSYGQNGILIDNTSSASTRWSNMRFSYLRTAFHVSRQASHSLSHAQIVNCDRAILVFGSPDLSVRNILIDQNTTAFQPRRLTKSLRAGRQRRRGRRTESAI